MVVVAIQSTSVTSTLREDAPAVNENQEILLATKPSSQSAFALNWLGSIPVLPGGVQEQNPSNIVASQE